MQQVYHLAVRRENDNFFILMGVEKLQKVYQSVLGGDFHVELLDLVWNRDGKLIVAVGCLVLKANCFVFLHHFGAQHLHFLRQSSAYKIHTEHI